MITFDEAQILGWLSALLMPLFRLLGLFSSAPLLSSRNIPVRYRVMAALSLAVLAAPLVHGKTPSFDDPAFFDPSTGSNSNAIGRLFNTMSLTSFAVINGPLLLVAATMNSLERMPASMGTQQFLGRLDIGAVISQVFELGLLMALPYMALLLFVNLSLGLISRVAPQLNVFAIGFPITIGSGLMLLTLGMPMLYAPLAQMHQAIFSLLGF